MVPTIVEIIIYLSFVITIYLVTYLNTNPNASLQVKHLRTFFLNKRQVDLDYTRILTIDQYWNWLEKCFFSNVFLQSWYNGDIPENQTDSINDKNNRLIGGVIMRQLRVKINPCQTHIVPYCKYDYSFSNEENQSFEPGWAAVQTQAFNSSVDQAFVYQTGDELDTYVYVGEHATYNAGGYAYEYQGNFSQVQSDLSELRQSNWTDGQTRALFIQLSLYNPNLELFTSAIFLVEFLSTGGLFPQHRINPICLKAFTSIFQLICMIMYVVFIIYYTIMESWQCLQQKWRYLLRFWSYVELGTIGCSWGAFGFYIFRYREAIRVDNRLKETKGNVFINLQTAAYANDVVTILLGFCCFFGSLKFLQFCQRHRCFSIFIDTLNHAMRDLIAFTMVLSLILIAFSSLFYLLFIDKISKCSTFLQTIQLLFQLIMLKCRVDKLDDSTAFLVPLCFSLFIVLVAFICMRIYASIIIHSFHIIQKDAKMNPTKDHDILLTIISKAKYLLSEKESIDEYDEQIRGTYRDPIENFPNKVEQLFTALDRMR